MKYFNGMILAQLVSADYTSSIHRLSEQGIDLKQVIFVDDLTVNILVSVRDYHRIKKYLRKGDGLRVIGRRGFFWRAKRIFVRPILVAVLLITLLGTLLLPKRILFVEVEGNGALPKALILEQAEDCGIHFWASRSVVRSEKVKNALLSRIPQLKWAAVTTKGCTATIHIEEETVQNTQSQPFHMNMFSVADGIVQEITVLRGTALCQVGEAVKKGQMLISGYTDCGISIQATGAEGEVYALTERKLQAVALRPNLQRTEFTQNRTGYSLRLGKKLIKFYKDSGISDGGCVKIKSSYCVRLPGGFALPVEIIKEEWLYGSHSTAGQGSYGWLEEVAQRYVTDHMQAGTIQNAAIDTHETQEGVVMEGTFSCREMIGYTNIEEFTSNYGKNE